MERKVRMKYDQAVASGEIIKVYLDSEDEDESEPQLTNQAMIQVCAELEASCIGSGAESSYKLAEVL
jgi:hypothetical protein